MTESRPPEYTLGDWTLYAISDGLYRLDGGAMFGVVPRVMWDRVKPPDERNRIDMCLSCLLAVKGDEKILIEAGIGIKNSAKFEFIYGVDHITSIDAELAKLGISTLDINHVVLSHLHFDHSGSLTHSSETGEIVPHFPNATHHTSAVELDTARHPNARNRASYIDHDWKPVLEAGLLQIHDEGTTFGIVDGMTCDIVGGHTPGQGIINIESPDADHSVVFVGDLIPTGAHVPIPWIMGYDLDPLKQVEVKTRLLEKWMNDGTLIIFPHETRYPWANVGMDEKGNYFAKPIDENWLEDMRSTPWPKLPETR